ncbi:helix-turn-helix domain-containing protein [Enterococcus phoeniculicola]|jgi:AraC family transcriptional regulator|uniref:HTH araC/xylS-type domain-containing protein n=1 Tax=Enterococcus phoeniculicola ATCC BAA-412 TaxID=1158610 RepID=R3WIF8_9ENTE|nr:AraC family transcriptional regulator [Enterococcus phoeniculicola]EOL41680.1 hypothetical protein UC3_03245 [Enterococcus phoeniculicola ATCC BAA-412]EOT78826.1 hypothetical protein I589_00331 [Enterococcus phoeniculicola ATCC BAA-412]
MKVTELGVLEESYIEFLAPTKFAQQALLNSPQLGEFICNDQYIVQREGLDLFLLCYIQEGELAFTTEDLTIYAKKDTIVLLDCRKPHSYQCLGHAKFMWIHFKGNQCALSVDYIVKKHGGILFESENHIEIQEYFKKIFASAYQTVMNEHMISATLQLILASLADTKEALKITDDHPIMEAVRYIHDHFNEQINVQFLADLSHMSVFHFIRVFKQLTNCTPHEYLVSYRLRQAKRLLQTTVFTNDEIALQCGFNSASHFARAFRAAHDLSPQTFRKLTF